MPEWLKGTGCKPCWLGLHRFDPVSHYWPGRSEALSTFTSSSTVKVYSDSRRSGKSRRSIAELPDGGVCVAARTPRCMSDDGSPAAAVLIAGEVSPRWRRRWRFASLPVSACRSSSARPQRVHHRPFAVGESHGDAGVLRYNLGFRPGESVSRSASEGIFSVDPAARRVIAAMVSRFPTNFLLSPRGANAAGRARQRHLRGWSTKGLWCDRRKLRTGVIVKRRFPHAARTEFGPCPLRVCVLGPWAQQVRYRGREAHRRHPEDAPLELVGHAVSVADGGTTR